jgi:hypothetical protein
MAPNLPFVFAFLAVIPEGNLLLSTLNKARKWVPLLCEAKVGKHNSFWFF